MSNSITFLSRASCGESRNLFTIYEFEAQCYVIFKSLLFECIDFQTLEDDDWLVGLFLLVWWCLTPLSTIFQLYRGGQFYLWRTRGKPLTCHWQTLLSHNVVHLALIEIRTHDIVVICTDCIGSCKSNYHTITATTAPDWLVG